MALERQLEYKDKFVRHLIRQIEGDCEGEPITFPDNTTPIKFVVEMNLNEFTSILSALMTGADLSYPETSHEVVWRFLRQVECPVSICEELLECLQPAFDEINAKLDNIQTDVDFIEENVTTNITQPPPTIVGGVDTVLCGAASAVVDHMHQTNIQVYNEAEAGIWDNLMEAFAAIVSAIPRADTLPAGVMATLTQSYFSNQYSEYLSDFELARQEMINKLYCQVVENDGEFTYDVWGDWLDGLDTEIPSNRAASLFARFSPFRQTFLNQIAALFNNDASLQSFFNELYQSFEAGKIDPQGTCGGAECYEPCDVVYDFANQPPSLSIIEGSLDSDGFMDSELFDSGGCNSHWVIFDCNVPAVGATGIRLVYNVGTIVGAQIYTPSVVYGNGDNPVHVGFETYVWQFDFPAPLTQNITAINTRQFCGDTTPFKLLRMEICFP